VGRQVAILVVGTSERFTFQGVAAGATTVTAFKPSGTQASSCWAAICSIVTCG